MAPLDVGRRMRLTDPEQFHAMVKMHLSFLLDLHTDECDCSFLAEAKTEKETVDSKLKKAFTPMKKAKARGVMDGVPLTQEGVCQVYQIVEFLGRPHNITTEGIFRKHGNLKKQQALKERLNRGVALDLDDAEFSVHECAAVLKHFLANLPEPLLTDAYYKAHCQVPHLVKPDMSEEDREAAVLKQISCVQLLFQLIPPVNLALLKDLLIFLQSVAKMESENKMNSTNLGTLFSTHILCPRKLSPETLQSNHQLLSSVVTFMIEHADKLFVLPDKLLLDVQTYINQKDAIPCTPTTRKGAKQPRDQCGPNSPVVSTVFSFVDREATQAATNGNETDKALAQLYAHVQSMPASAKKSRLVKKLNDANGKGTPDVSTSGSVRTMGRGAARQRRKSGDGLMNLLTPRRKRPPVTGSYSVQGAVGGSRRELVSSSNSFRRQTSQPSTPMAPPRAALLSPSHLSSPAVLSPCRERLPSPTLASTPSSQASEVAEVDEVDTPGRESGCSAPGSPTEADASWTAGPPLPPRTPAPRLEVTAPAAPGSLSPGVQRAMATPRSRGGLMVSVGQLEKWNRLMDTAKPEHLVFEEGDEEEDVEEEEEMEDEEKGEEDEEDSEDGLEGRLPGRGKAGVYRCGSLSSEFQTYLAEQGLQPAGEEGEEMEDSLLDPDRTPRDGGLLDASYSEEVRRLLRGPDTDLSTSMQAILDGGSPSCSTTSRSSLRSGRSCGSSSTLKALAENTFQAGGETRSPSSRRKEGSSSPRGAENEAPAGGEDRRGVKRRSLTETGEGVRLLQAGAGIGKSIYFETDL